MTDLSNEARVVLGYLYHHPERDTLDAILADPKRVQQIGREEIVAGFLELVDSSLAVEQRGRWSLTDAGRAAMS